MSQVLRTSQEAIQFPTADGDTYRLDPNSKIRFRLRTGEITPWIRGRELWRSDLGISFPYRNAVYFVGWHEVETAQVENLSGAKTYGVILLVGAAVAVVVILIAGKGKIGKLPGGAVGAGGKGAARAARGASRFMGGVALTTARVMTHRAFHIPIYIAVHSSTRRDAPPPPPSAPRPWMEEPGVAPPPAAPAPATAGVVDIEDEPGAPAPAVRVGQRKRARATPLFSARARRRSMIQFLGSAGAGTELVRLHTYTGSVTFGMRIRDVFELAGGLRHTMDPQVYGQTGDEQSGVIGFGRAGFHFWIDDDHRFALPLSVDVGAGHNVRLHFRLNYGLRFSPLRSFWIGLMPFNASYSELDGDTFVGTQRWTFPTTLELGFNL